MFKLQVVIGSTRIDRNADSVCRWFVPVARSHGAFEVEVLDMRDWALPFFQETLITLGDIDDPTYSDPLVKRWNEKIKEADAYVLVTPEYPPPAGHQTGCREGLVLYDDLDWISRCRGQDSSRDARVHIVVNGRLSTVRAE